MRAVEERIARWTHLPMELGECIEVRGPELFVHTPIYGGACGAHDLRCSGRCTLLCWRSMWSVVLPPLQVHTPLLEEHVECSTTSVVGAHSFVGGACGV